MTSSMYCPQDETMETQSADAAAVTSCLLDVMSIRLTEMDLYSARRVDDHHKRRLSPPRIVDGDIKFRGYHLRMDKNRPLKERSVVLVHNKSYDDLLFTTKYEYYQIQLELLSKNKQRRQLLSKTCTLSMTVTAVSLLPCYSYCSCL